MQEVSRRVLTSRQLDLILAVGRSRSLREAATSSALSQSGMTRHLQTMEERLGTKLVVRSHAGIRLTEAGERLHTLAKITRRLETDLMFELSAGSSSLRGQVRICGFSSVMRSVILPSVMPLVRKHTALTIQYIVEELYLVAGRGTSGDADIFITQVPLRIAGFTSMVLGHEHNVLVESALETTPENVYIDHEPNDRFSEHYLTMARMPIPAPLRRLYFDDIYGLLDGVKHGAGRAVVPVHLLTSEIGVRVVRGAPTLLVPVVLNIQTQLLEFTTMRAVVDQISCSAAALLQRNDPGVDLSGAIDGAFAGPSHRFSGRY